MGEYLCWAACLTSAVEYVKNVNVKQAAFPRFLFNGQILDLPVPMSSVELCLDHWGIDWTFNPRPIMFSAIKAAIRSGRPGFAGLFFFLGGAHLVEIRGYYELHSVPFVSYMDPSDGQMKLMAYSLFKNNTTNGWNWVETLYNFYI